MKSQAAVEWVLLPAIASITKTKRTAPVPIAKAALRQLEQARALGPAKKLAEKISAKIKAAPMMIQMSQSISTVSIFVYRRMRVNQGLCRMSFTGSSDFLRILRFSNSTTTAKAMAK